MCQSPEAHKNLRCNRDDKIREEVDSLFIPSLRLSALPAVKNTG